MAEGDSSQKAGLMGGGDPSLQPFNAQASWDEQPNNAEPSPWESQLPQGDVPAVPEADAENVRIDFVSSTTSDPHPAVSQDRGMADEFIGPAMTGLGLNPGGGPSAAPGKTAFWQLGHYQRLFDVDTEEVAKRMLGAIFFRKDLFEEVEQKPDLYGPIWITTTCIFLMAMISNALDWFANKSSEEEWEGDLEKIVNGAAIMYGYVALAGFILWFYLKVINLAQISLTALWCIYGYSMTIWLPVTMLAIVPNHWFLWALCFGASGYSGIFLYRNLKPAVVGSLSSEATQHMVLLVIFCAHQGVAVALRFFVLKYTLNVSAFSF